MVSLRRAASCSLVALVVAVAGCSSDGSTAEESSGATTTEVVVDTVDTAAGIDDPDTSTAPDASTAPDTSSTTSDATLPADSVEPSEATDVSTTGAPETTDDVPTTADEPAAGDGDFSALTSVVQGFIDERGLNGAGLIVVERDSGVVHEEYWGEFGPDRISLIASSSKMITAGVLLHLQDQGLLDIDAPIADVAPWGAGNPEITPAQLVSNSSGLVGLFPDPAYSPYVCQYIAVGTLQDCASSIFTTADDDADVIPPDTEFRYGGAQWQVAGAVAEVASGRTWAELIDEIYVEPCGLETLAYNNHFTQIGSGGFDYPAEFGSDPSTLAATDNPNMEGGVYTNTTDYANLLLMHLRGGMCGDVQVLSQESLDLLHGDRIAAAYDGSARPDTGYGMGWWIDRETGVISDAGAYGSVPWLDLDEGYGAYLVIEADSGTGAELTALIDDIVHDAVTADG